MGSFFSDPSNQWVISLVAMAILILCVAIMFLVYMIWSQKKPQSADSGLESQMKINLLEEKTRTYLLEIENQNREIDQLRALHLEVSKKLSQTEAIIPQLEESQQQARRELKTLQSESQIQIQAQMEKIHHLEASKQILQTEKALLQQQLDTLIQSYDEKNKQSKAEFEILAQKILEDKSKKFNEQSEKNLDQILTPLKEKIQLFEKTVDDKYNQEARERHALKSEIERLISLNDKMTFETQSLTKALRGDSKVQGDWGELVLERILESSGLRENHEYTLQSTHLNQEGDRLRPDVLIHLPEEKHIIVDSKVSLKSYDQYRTEESEAQKARSLSEHLKSIEKHVEDLSNKHYSKLKGIHSPEVVFMFIPIEPAYMLAMQSDPELSSRAWKKGVAIVTSTTLLTSLKTVASIWRLEKQNKNAQEIALEGAKLYDKFVGFVEDFEKIGHTFEVGQKHYSQAMNKLKDGPGNVFRKIELLRELGAAPNKRIKTELLE